MQDPKPFRIVVAGLGGVGGFFGGKLAAYYSPGHAEATVAFVARGTKEAAIRAHGLWVEEAGEEPWTARPAQLVADPAALEPADLVIVCTKGYDLEATIEQLRPCLGPSTVVLPLLNGGAAPAQRRGQRRAHCASAARPASMGGLRVHCGPAGRAGGGTRGQWPAHAAVWVASGSRGPTGPARNAAAGCWHRSHAGPRYPARCGKNSCSSRPARRSPRH